MKTSDTSLNSISDELINLYLFVKATCEPTTGKNNDSHNLNLFN